ncbi:acetylornithine aminotransferase/acetylornithine/N-succinyldiaminopimelate aminotransferase [Bryocella elongata]|uniref:Acetylornithine aminotransferase n=1 Tax=Bryocella elongata TaxID=863522 RepID=A0A1H6B4K2_9BACT|nr:aspartate aminotransferase family protein [Bryocella elongata]SEG55540.1 acetylornithine aminotransferase/acetylornithine/N-succinyldiaminopimelate aminotransferase [Bryocella elongata]
MPLADLQAAESKLLMQTYARNPIEFVSGNGVYLRDDQGNDYLDLLSGIGVCALGYNHPVITNALAKQAESLIHTSNLFYNANTTELALRLTEMTGLDRVFFCNSGTEAWEAALKLARAHAGLLRAEGKHIGTRFIALENSFHGRTMGSVATTHKAAYREPFQPVMPDVVHIPFNDVAALKAAFSEEVCGVCIEVLQGEGGINPVSEEFLRTARELCDSTGALLLLDEIQSGMGRTGKWCAYQHYDIQPDITTLAKPLAGGVPMGAMLATEEASRAFTPGMHGTTFGGNPLATGVAIAVIDEIKHAKLLDHAAEIGNYFIAQLNSLKGKHESIAEVRGMGLMLGVEMHSADVAKSVLDGMFAKHIVLNRTHETVLRFLPPFLITREHVDQTIAALDELFTQQEVKSTDAALTATN